MKRTLLITLCALSVMEIVAQAPFSNKKTISTNTGNFPKVIESSYIDNDAFVDIVIGTNLGGTIEWYRNNANGTFSLQALITSTLPSVNGLALADLDNDGDNDVIATSSTMNKLVWFANDGYGNFGAEQLIANGLSGAGTVKAGLIDSDNFIDLVVLAYSSDTVVWFSNSGSGGFSSAQTVSNISNSGPRDLDLGDYDQDGDLDIVVGYGKLYSVKLFNNNLVQTSNASFTVEANNVVSGNFYINDVAFGDVDNDGDLEILKADLLTNTAAYKKQANGTFTETIFTTSNVYPTTVLVSDLDDNDINDVTIGYSSTNTTDYMTWYQDSNPTSESTIDNTQNDIYSFTVNDFDNDGDLDMASTSSSENHLNWFENTTYTASLSIDESEIEVISISPNPTSNFITISGINELSTPVEVYDLLGKSVLKTHIDNNHNQIDFSNFKSGIYLLKLYNGSNKTYKVVKQ